MVFSNSSTKQGLMEDIDFLCGTVNASYPLADKTRNVNRAYEDVVRLIWECVDNWEYDDSNKTDLPIATTTLGHNQQDYAVPSTAQKIYGVDVKDSAGNYQKLEPKKPFDMGMARTEYAETSGLPREYDLLGNSVFLYPPPSSADTTLAAGLKVYFDRSPTLFTTASTTAAPGFADPFHRILSYSASIDYEKNPQKLQQFMIDRQRLIDGLKKFYGVRNVEEPTLLNSSSRRYWRQYR